METLNFINLASLLLGLIGVDPSSNPRSLLVDFYQVPLKGIFTGDGILVLFASHFVSHFEPDVTLGAKNHLGLSTLGVRPYTGI